MLRARPLRISVQPPVCAANASPGRRSWVRTISVLSPLAMNSTVTSRVEVRTSKYLNNIVEQDHRAIKRRCASMKGFKSFANVTATIAGIELAYRIHKR